MLNYLLYFIGWFVLVVGGANGYSLLPALIVVFALLFQLYKDKQSAYYIDLFLILTLLLLGFLFELVLIHFQIVKYAHSTSPLPPLWVLMIYPLFAMTINHSFYWVMQNPYLSFALGLIGAPLTYLAAERLGAVSVHHLYVLGIMWALFLLLTSLFFKQLNQIVAEILTISHAEDFLSLLYDGDCPLCSKEASYLEKQTTRVHFVDISSNNYQPEMHQKITYAQAMQKMHAIENNQVLVGLEAFKKLYAKSNQIFLAILISLPGLNVLFESLYSIFAKYRLPLTGRSFDEKKYWKK